MLIRLGLAAAALLAGTTALAREAKAPIAAKKPHEVPSPNGAREDDYYWLRDDTRKNPEMLAYLKAENAYADSTLAPLKPLQDKLFAEIVGHVKQNDSSVPWHKHGYWYASRFATGAEYAIIERHKGTMNAPAQVLLDQPTMAQGHNFFAVSDWKVSPDDTLLAYAEDTVGRRQYTLRVKDIATGKLLPDTIENVEPNLVWTEDNKTLVYIAT